MVIPENPPANKSAEDQQSQNDSKDNGHRKRRFANKPGFVAVTGVHIWLGAGPGVGVGLGCWCWSLSWCWSFRAFASCCTSLSFS